MRRTAKETRGEYLLSLVGRKDIPTNPRLISSELVSGRVPPYWVSGHGYTLHRTRGIRRDIYPDFDSHLTVAMCGDSTREPFFYWRKKPHDLMPFRLCDRCFQ